MHTDSAPRWVANGIAHFDIARPQFDALRTFSAGVFRWTVTDRGPGYAQIETPPGSPNGALLEAPESGLTIRIAVPELGRSLELAVARGTIAIPPTDNGFVRKAQIVDPAGNRVTVIQG